MNITKVCDFINETGVDCIKEIHRTGRPWVIAVSSIIGLALLVLLLIVIFRKSPKKDNFPIVVAFIVVIIILLILFNWGYPFLVNMTTF